MSSELAPLTQAISRVEFHPKDQWVVVVDKREFVLDGKQAELLKKATQANMRGIIWFEKFAISIPHIQSIHRHKSGAFEEKQSREWKQYQKAIGKNAPARQIKTNL